MPEQRDDRKPEAHDRTEQRTHAPGPPLLHDEEPGENNQRDRNDVGLERGRRDLEAFDRRQHGNRRRDRAVAIEKRGTCQAQQHQNARAARTGLRMHDQRHQRHDPAFALVVRAHDEDHVLDRHHQHQRPEDERQDAQDVVFADRHRVMGPAKHLLQCVQRTGADIAIHHAQRAERQNRQTLGVPGGALNHWTIISLQPAPRRAVVIGQVGRQGLRFPAAISTRPPRTCRHRRPDRNAGQPSCRIFADL